MEPKPTTSHKPRRLLKTLATIFVVVLLILGAYAAGFNVGIEEGRRRPEPPAGSGRVVNTATSTPGWLSRDVDFGLYWDLWTIIQSRYIDHPVEEPKLFYGSLAGMVAALGDPYSQFFEPKDAEEFSNELQGHFEGIGAEIGIRENRLTVIAPLAESPAERAGLKAGDWITSIDGRDTSGIDLGQAVSKIRGERGSTVRLSIWRESFDEPRDFNIVRDQIRIVSVQWSMKEGDIAYVKITNFNSDTGQRFRSAVEEAFKTNPKSFIVDVRNNPGGYLDMAVELASYWVEEGSPVVLERSVEKGTSDYRAVRNQILRAYPTVILTNKGSASASEILSGALQDYGLATVVGETSFGKGSIQDLKELSDGSAVKLTIARWLTPKERQIDQEGIKPDVEVELTEEDAKEGRDPQLEKALEVLNTRVQSSNAK